MVKVRLHNSNRNKVKQLEYGQKILGDDDMVGLMSLVPGVRHSRLWNDHDFDRAF